MSRVRVAILLFAALCLVNPAQAVRGGDEGYEVNTAGSFFVFADKAVNIIDPTTLTVTKTLTADSAGQPLTNAGAAGATANSSITWNDAVYVDAPTPNTAYIFANEGDVYTDANGTQYSYVSCINTVTQQYVSRVRVGARPVHLYFVENAGEIWSHSDAEGTFYIISINDVTRLNATVPGFSQSPGHGKLIVDGLLWPRAYASNVNEQVIQEINLQTRTRIASHSYGALLPSPGLCTGTHSVGWTNATQHAFIECVDATGVLEWNTATNTLVAFHGNISGGIEMSPNNDHTFVIDASEGIVNVLTPAGPSQPSAVGYSISVTGNPYYPVFYSNATVLQDAEEYTVYFPLSRVTNKGNVAGALARGSSVDAPEYNSAPTDCQYAQSVATASASSGATGLQLATRTNGQPVTPNCGACAAGVSRSDPAQFNASLSGFGMVSFDQVEAAASQDREPIASLLAAGSTIIEANAESDANACSYGEAYRRASRGGAYVVIVADFPQPSLYVVDASAPGSPLYGKGWVGTSPHPTVPVWAPAATAQTIYTSP